MNYCDSVRVVVCIYIKPLHMNVFHSAAAPFRLGEAGGGRRVCSAPPVPVALLGARVCGEYLEVYQITVEKATQS